MSKTSPYSTEFIAPEGSVPGAEVVSSPETSVTGDAPMDANPPAGTNAAAPVGGQALEPVEPPTALAEEPLTPEPAPEAPAANGKPTYEQLLESSRYWQSEHDKKVQAMHGELEEARMFRPVIEAINSHPELMRTVADAMQAPSPAANGQTQEITIPEPPAPPADPFSEEGEGYQQQIYEWAKSLSESQKALVASQHQAQEAATQQREAAITRNHALSEAMNRYHLPQDKAGELVNDLTLNGPAIGQIFGSIDKYVEYKFAVNTPTAQEIRQREALESARQQQEQRTPPLATGAEGASTPAQTTQFAGMSARAPNPYEQSEVR